MIKKAFYLTFLFIAFSFFSIGQTADQLIREYDELKKANLSSLITNKENEIIKWVENNTDIGIKYYSNKEYILADPYFKKSLEIIKRVFGTTNQLFTINLNNLAVLYKESGDLKSSEDCYKSLVEITKIAFGEDNIEFYYAINGIAYLYYDNGDYKSAEPYLKLSLELSKKQLGEENNEYSGTLNNLGYLYYNIGDYKSSEYFFKQTIEIRKKYLGESNQIYANTLYSLGNLYFENKNYKLAEPVLKKSQEILKSLKIENTEIYSTILSELGNIYLNSHDYKLSELFYLNFIDIKRKFSGTENKDYALGLYNLGYLYSEMDNYKLSEKYYKESLEIRKKKLGEEHPDYISSVNNLGTLYFDMNDYQSAEKYYRLSLEINEKVFGNKSIEFASSMGNLGSLYIKFEDYINARIYLEKSIEIYKLLGSYTLEYSYLLSSIGNLNIMTNDYLASETNFKKSLEIKQKIFGELNLECVNDLNNLSSIYAHFSNFNLAEEYLNRSLYLIENSKGKSSLDYIIPLNNLAVLYLLKKDYVNALKNLEQCLEIISNKLGTFNLQYSDCLSNISAIYALKGDYKTAKLYIQKSLNIVKKLKGEFNLDYAHTLFLLGWFNFEQGDFTSSEISLHRSLLVYEKILGRNNLECSNILLLISYINLRNGDDISFTKNNSLSLDIRINELNNNFKWFSESERFAYWNVESKYYTEIISRLISINSIVPSAAESIFNSTLISKALLLESNRNSLDLLKTNKDSSLTSSFNNLRELRANYSKLSSEGSDKLELMKKINHEADSLDLLLSRKNNSYASSKKKLQAKWQDVQANLNSNETAIEFARYFDEKDSTYHYMALVVKVGDKCPQLIKLCSEKELSNFSPETELKELYNLIWKPLLPVLNNIKTVYYSPVGLLNNIPFHALFNYKADERNYVIDDYTLHQLTSTRYLALGLKQKVNEITEPSIALFGGINYNDFPTTKTDTINKLAVETAFVCKNIIRDIDDSPRSGAFYLPGSKKEVDNIANLLNSKQWNVSLVEDKNASEGKVKSFSGSNSKSILHIATHGFAFPDKEETKKRTMYALVKGSEKYTASDNPMIRCGLLFGGANITWKGKSDSLLNATNDDGILTAYELSQLDLSNTKLAVLSACETGKGAIQGSEGTFGLKRALKLAGVDNIIVSLWKVPDDATMQMMTLFYNELSKTKNPVTSFEFAQKTMRNLHTEHPENWAGFVLVR